MPGVKLKKETPINKAYSFTAVEVHVGVWGLRTGVGRWGLTLALWTYCMHYCSESKWDSFFFTPK